MDLRLAVHPMCAGWDYRRRGLRGKRGAPAHAFTSHLVTPSPPPAPSPTEWDFGTVCCAHLIFTQVLVSFLCYQL